MTKAMTGLLRGVAGEVKRAAAGAREDAGAKRKPPARRGKRSGARWFIWPRSSSLLYLGAAVILL